MNALRQVFEKRLAAAVVLLTFVFILPASQTWALTEESTFGAELPVQTGGIRFTGEASPGALVTFLRNGSVIGTQVAASDSSFDDTFTNQPLGSATYGLYYTDAAGRISDTVTNSATILPTYTTTLSGYLLPATFEITLNPMRRPQTQVVRGATRQDSTVTVFWSGTKYSDSFTTQTTSDANGNWSANPATTLHLGSYAASAVVQEPNTNQSPQTTPANFDVNLSADLNNDNRVNLTDFSILMFYYLQTGINKPADINDDSRTNLTDLSIMLFYWTS